jgi:hypothetical protein
MSKDAEERYYDRTGTSRSSSRSRKRTFGREYAQRGLPPATSHLPRVRERLSRHRRGGNEYLDFVDKITSLIHGHAVLEVVEPAIEAIRASNAPGGPTRTEIAYAEHYHDRVPGLDSIRFTNSGTEAVMNAVRAARAHAGNDTIAKIDGRYRGSFDDAQVSVQPPLELAGPRQAPESVANIAGVPDPTVDNPPATVHRHRGRRGPTRRRE